MVVLAEFQKFKRGAVTPERSIVLKIGVGGPPHSGKTVLMGLIRGLLPRDKFIIVEAAPDGEGITGWSAEATQELVKAVRHKGKFLPAFVELVVQSIRNSRMPITLVDLGGMLLDDEGKFTATGVKLTPENELMIRECTHLVVIANPSYMETAVPVWIAEAERLRVKPFAILESVLSGADDEVFAGSELPMRARITKLDRENPPVSSTAKAVAEKMLALLATEIAVRDGSEIADVNFPRLAEELDLPVKSGGDHDWRPLDLPKVLADALTRLAEKSEARLWGNTPLGAPYHILAANLSQAIRYADPKVPGGYVLIPELTPSGTGSLLDWKIGEREDFSLVEFSIPGQVFNADTLPQLVVPEVNTHKGVVVSGKGPRWLTGAIVRAYARASVAWVAVFEPRESGRLGADGKKWADNFPNQAPAIVVCSQEQSHGVGTVVPFGLMEKRDDIPLAIRNVVAGW